MDTEHDKFLVEIGKRIKETREKAKLSQKQLALKCDFGKSNISRLEAGKTNVTLITLRKICTSLDTDISVITSQL